MKTISEALAEHLSGEVTTLATCWKVTRRDGVEMGFTNHDRDLEIDALNYAAHTGFTPTAVVNTSNLSVDNLDVEGMLSSTGVTESDIMAGLYDFAEIEIFMVNYTDLTQGRIHLRRGWLGEVAVNGDQFVAEMRGLAQRLSQTMGELFSPSCRASLGDARCKVDMEEHIHSGTVTVVTSNQEFHDEDREEASTIFTGGSVAFTSGANEGLSMEVKEYILENSGGGRIILAMPMPYAIEAGDSYTMTKGCDKTLETCVARFDNALNFRGEPHVPGMDKMLETAGTRSDF